jgi:protein SCO1/2
MNRRWTLLWAVSIAALLMGALAAYAAFRLNEPDRSFQAVDITGAEWGKGFELTDHHGVRRTLADFRGKAVMLFFGYTYCPDMCPTTMALLAGALQRMGDGARDVQVLFVTIDPKRDTPQVLGQYLPAFHPTFLGLYADAETTARTVREFKGYYRAQPPDEHGGYTVDHTGQVYVFDPQGRLRLFIKPDASPDSIVHDLRLLLAEARG